MLGLKQWYIMNDIFLNKERSIVQNNVKLTINQTIDEVQTFLNNQNLMLFSIDNIYFESL